MDSLSRFVLMTHLTRRGRGWRTDEYAKPVPKNTPHGRVGRGIIDLGEIFENRVSENNQILYARHVP